MRTLENVCTAIRHSRGLRDAEWLWGRLRSPYSALLSTVAPNGIERVLNGSHPIRLLPECRNVREDYEPEVFKLLMEESRPGDVVADVGANVGLYSIAFARQVGAAGTVHAFEPDPDTFRMLQRHCSLNHVNDRVRLHQAAAGDRDGSVSFECGQGLESHIGSGPGSVEIDCVRLDSVLASSRVDVLKIDVEGYEESVLRGAAKILGDAARGPRFVYIEVHPFAWQAAGTTSDSLLGLLHSFSYRVEDLTGKPVTHIDAYGGIVARRPGISR